MRAMKYPENDILLRRAGKIAVRTGTGQQSDAVVASLVLEASQFGYALKPEVIEAFRSVDDKHLQRSHSDLLALLRASVGAHRQFKPLYPGFPAEVLGMSDARLCLNAVTHYFTAGTWSPPSITVSRTALDSFEAWRRIGLAEPGDLRTIAGRLVSSKSSLSLTDVSDLTWLLKHFRDHLPGLIPEKIAHRENAAIVASVLWFVNESYARVFIANNLKSATDLLRFCVALNDGDVSLAKPTKFVLLPRSIRKLAMNKLEAAPDLIEDLRRRPERWKRLGERLHPGAYSATHPKTAAAFASIRQNLAVDTFACRAERSMRQPDVMLQVCLERPGEFARRFDALVRRHPNQAAVTAAFGGIAHQVSTSVLVQLHAHLDPSVPQVRLRVFLPKGQTAKLWARPNDRKILPLEVRTSMITHIETALVERFARLSQLGKTYVHESLRKFMVPVAMRATSRSLRTVARGSRLAAPPERYVRMFLWWTNGRGRTDIDLSAALFDKNYKYVSTVAYYNLKDWGAVHSGDIVDAPKGAAEFIDFDTKLLLQRDVRYVIMNVNSYSAQSFGELPECFAGWMARRDANSGEIFEPRTVIDRADLTSETTIAIPVIFDLMKREMIWADLSLKAHPYYNNNVASNLFGVTMLIEAMATLRRPNLYTLFSLHARARGTQVFSADEADTVFAPDSGITPFDVDVIRSEFL
jgi:hypothetical protein